MNATLANKIRRILTGHATRTSLEQFFETAGVEMDEPLYPPLIREMMSRVPIVSTRVEIKPHVVELDPTTNAVRVGWNLFVMGNNRLYLGTSVHESMEDLNRQAIINGEKSDTSERFTTPKQIINFIIDTLNEHEQAPPLGPIMYQQPTMPQPKMPPLGSYYERNRSLGTARAIGTMG